MQKILLTLILIIFNTQSALAENFTPYFASIKSDEVNVRKGPNARYSIEWVYKKRGEPVEVIASFEHWRRIKDFSGDEGWMRSSMLSKKRSAIITHSSKQPNNQQDSFINMYKKPELKAKIIAKIENSKRVTLEQCQKDWCKIKINNISGWIEKQSLWGVSASEEF